MDTTKIKVCHTSKNLYEHNKTVLVAWEIKSSSDGITINYNNIDTNDIGAQDVEEGVDYLRDVHYHSEEEDEEIGMLNTTRSQTYDTQNDETQMTEDHEDDDTHLSQSSQAPDNLSRSNAQNVITESPDTDTARHSHVQKVTFISDNAVDIAKALKIKYQWLGCAAQPNH